MAGETNIQIVKAAQASTISHAPTTTPDKDVVQQTNQGQVTKTNGMAQEDAKKVQESEKREQRQFSDEELADFVEEIESSVQNVQRDLRFAVDKNSGDTIIKVIDSQTDEIIRQIPSEEIIEMRQRIQSFTSGSLIDGKA